MPLAERKLDLIARLAATDDPAVLDIVDDALGRDAAEPPSRPDEDEVLGVRPDGAPVTLRNSAEDWERGVDEVLAGGGISAEEVIAKFEKRAHGE